MKSFFATALSVLLISQGVVAAPSSSEFQKKIDKWIQSSAPAAKKMDAFYKLYWEHLMVTYPEWATYQGYPGQNDRWSDRSLASIEKMKQETFSVKKALAAVSEKKLKGEDLMTYRLFKYRLEESIEGFQFPDELLPIDQMGGVHTDVAEILIAAPKRNLKDYQDMLKRLTTFSTPVDQVIALMREGLSKGITQPKITLAGLPAQFDKVLTEKAEDSPLYKPFAEIDKSILTPEQTAQVQKEAKEALTNVVFPSLRKMKDFLVKEYIPACRESIALSALPNGQKWYNYRIKTSTTTDLTSEQIFQIGNSEVQRIRGEMEKIREQVKFKKDLKAFNEYLKTDSKFFYTSAEDLLNGFRAIGKTIDPELPRFFGKLPRNTYGIMEMQAFKAPSSPAAYYHGGSLEVGRPGYFVANTYDLKARPKWAMVDLTCHEAVPGHHLQISLAQDLENLPEIRKNAGYTAYVEGWALYAEQVCDEMGLYKTPYDKYGMLTAEMWRAVRLVVDTGMHSKGWTREQAMQFFRDAGPFSEQEIRAETDRYIVWAGQALAYKLGQLKISELREKSKQALGEKFDIRQFHDQVLGSGALPLKVLEAKINDWVKAEKEKRTTTSSQISK